MKRKNIKNQNYAKALRTQLVAQNRKMPLKTKNLS